MQFHTSSVTTCSMLRPLINIRNHCLPEGEALISEETDTFSKKIVNEQEERRRQTSLRGHLPPGHRHLGTSWVPHMLHTHS